MALSPLALRVISSAVLIPVVVGIIWVGGWVFAGFATLCILIALYEWVHITKNIPTTPLKKNLLYVAGVFYLGFSFFEIIYLRNSYEGFLLTLSYMICIWASDSGAYLFGKVIGGKKMSPTISPNKTWAGYIGAMLSPATFLTILMYIIFDDFFDPQFAIATFVTGLTIGIAGQSGDLLISAMKRKAGLKDTGALIPGHGGILDRIDALLMALPVFLAYVKYAME